MTHIVAISGGKDSTAMALRLQEVEPRDYTFAITPTGRELPTMTAHWARLETLLGKPLLRIPAPSFLDRVKKYRTLPNYRMRWCTREIKLEPFMSFVQEHLPATTYIGIRADEVLGSDPRQGTNWNGIEGVTQDFPMVRWCWDQLKVRAYLIECGVTIPPRTDCDICFFQRLIEWYELWRDYPELWREGEALEAFTGHTLRSDQRDSWPASMAGLRTEFERGRVPEDTRKRQPQRQTMCAWCAR